MRLGSRTLFKVAHCWFESNLYRMGYYTRYDFSIVEADGLGYVEHKRKLELIESFRKESHGAAYAFDEFGNSNDEVKWYDCQKDILEFSIKNPSIIFLISGVGEERSDDCGNFMCKMDIHKFLEQKLSTHHLIRLNYNQTY